jgi:hypothetical protein
MSDAKRGDSGRVPVTSALEVRHLAGPIEDATVVEILGMEPTIEDLEVAALHARGQAGRPKQSVSELSGTAALVYDVLLRDHLYQEAEP